ncbi:hypothetical protein AAULR_22219 [Lacticaseibacillus rhamnosus MTCC 5462]|nr:hypothetical protein AAULR_22219 [Lacticaseibacillus rhamnosus MTCC 5462]
MQSKGRHLRQKISDGLFDCLVLLPPITACYNKHEGSIGGDRYSPDKTVQDGWHKIFNQKTVIFSKD